MIQHYLAVATLIWVLILLCDIGFLLLTRFVCSPAASVSFLLVFWFIRTTAIGAVFIILFAYGSLFFQEQPELVVLVDWEIYRSCVKLREEALRVVLLTFHLLAFIHLLLESLVGLNQPAHVRVKKPWRTKVLVHLPVLIEQA